LRIQKLQGGTNGDASDAELRCQYPLGWHTGLVIKAGPDALRQCVRKRFVFGQGQGRYQWFHCVAL
jgi:hypothetical protein